MVVPDVRNRQGVTKKCVVCVCVCTTYECLFDLPRTHAYPICVPVIIAVSNACGACLRLCVHAPMSVTLTYPRTQGVATCQFVFLL